MGIPWKGKARRPTHPLGNDPGVCDVLVADFEGRNGDFVIPSFLGQLRPDQMKVSLFRIHLDTENSCMSLCQGILLHFVLFDFGKWIAFQQKIRLGTIEEEMGWSWRR